MLDLKSRTVCIIFAMALKHLAGTSCLFKFRGSKGTEVGLAPLAQTGPGSNLGAHFLLLLDVVTVISTELLLPMLMMLLLLLLLPFQFTKSLQCDKTKVMKAIWESSLELGCN